MADARANKGVVNPLRAKIRRPTAAEPPQGSIDMVFGTFILIELPFSVPGKPDPTAELAENFLRPSADAQIPWSAGPPGDEATLRAQRLREEFR